MEDPSWVEAIKSELKNIKDRNSWVEIDEKDVPSGTKTLETKWVFTVVQIR